MRVALNCDGSGESRDREGSIDLREGIAQGVLYPVASPDEGRDGQDDDKGDGDSKSAKKVTAQTIR